MAISTIARCALRSPGLSAQKQALAICVRSKPTAAANERVSVALKMRAKRLQNPCSRRAATQVQAWAGVANITSPQGAGSIPQGSVVDGGWQVHTTRRLLLLVSWKSFLVSLCVPTFSLHWVSTDSVDLTGCPDQIRSARI